MDTVVVIVWWVTNSCVSPSIFDVLQYIICHFNGETSANTMHTLIVLLEYIM